MKELFGQRLREQRQNQGLTMEQLAEKANLSTNFIGAIERGLKEPSLSTLISILNALDIPADVLLRDYVGTASHVTDVGDTGMSYVIPWSSIPQELQQPLRRYVAQADGKLCGYCKEDLCNTENGRMIVELYLGKQEHHVSRILY